MVRLTEHEGVSRETVRRRLAEDDLKPWRRDMWCIPQVDGTYVARMEDVLDLYAEEADPKRPVVCFDESPTQLIGEVREPIPAEPGQPERYDCEYRRNGTANLFVFLDAHRSWRHVKVTDQRTAQDFAVCMRDLADIHYPDADQIRVVMDNLSTHTAGALYETFPAPEAHRILQRLEFHYTPKHASWLNMVEIEIGVLRGQCLDRRIGDRAVLNTEVAGMAAPAQCVRRAHQMEVHNAEGAPEVGPRLSRHRQRVEITVTRVLALAPESAWERRPGLCVVPTGEAHRWSSNRCQTGAHRYCHSHYRH